MKGIHIPFIQENIKYQNRLLLKQKGSGDVGHCSKKILPKRIFRGRIRKGWNTAEGQL